MLRDFIEYMGWTRFTAYRAVSWLAGFSMFLLWMHEPLTLVGPWVSDVGMEPAGLMLVAITLACLVIGWVTYISIWTLFTVFDLTITSFIRKITT
jgi:uncharacterized membrane protein